ncbi:MAG TPA: V-type ATPase subunit [Clostridia bacterium]|nr:V-type ATPase subunit [Clostridia bacterium]
MLKINEGDYAYASARIRAKEPKLLRSVHFDRMLDASSSEDALKILAEAEYGFDGEGSADIFNYEKLLDDELRKTFLLLLEIAPQPEIVKAFQRKYDFFNVKVLLKAELSGQEIPPILAGTGTFAKEAIVRMIRERDVSEFTQIMREAVVEARNAFARLQDPQVIDLLLDKASYHQFVSDIGQIDSLFLREIAGITIDTVNMRMFIRARALGREWDFIKKLLLVGGTIPEGVFSNHSDKPADAFIDTLRSTRYGDAVFRGWELSSVKSQLSGGKNQLSGEGSKLSGVESQLTSAKSQLSGGKNSGAGLEKQLDDYLMGFIHGAKLVTTGVEPVIAWLFAKETEIRNVRIIMTGRINRLPVETIRERLRAGYV